MDEVQRSEDRSSWDAVRVHRTDAVFDHGFGSRARVHLERLEVRRGFARCARAFSAVFSVDPNRIELSTS